MNETVGPAMDMLIKAIFLAVANKALVDYLANPIRKKKPEWDLWWLGYVAFVTGAALGWVSGIDILSFAVADPTASRFVSALFIGGGASLIHDIYDQRGSNAD